MNRLQPLGDTILVFPLPTEHHVTESGIQVMDTQLAKGKVMEVSDDYKDVYKKGDIIIYAKESGISQYYENKSCLFLNAKGYPQGHVLCIVEEENQ